MKSRFYFSLFFSLSVVLYLSACKKKDTDNAIPVPPAAIKIDKTNIALTNTINTSDSFSIQANVNWIISLAPANPSWLTVSSVGGTTNTKVYITVKETNNTGVSRTATITVNALTNTSIQPLVLTVTQGKNSPTNQSDSIVGRWMVVNDSLANIGNYYTNSGFPNAGNYVGVATDYLEFRANGEFYYQESTYSGSSTYQLFPNNKITIYNFQPGTHKASIKNLTASSMTLYGSDTSANGGIVIKIINLKK